MDDFEGWMCKIDTFFYFVLIDGNALFFFFFFFFREKENFNLWCSLMIIALYHQTKISISFLMQMLLEN